MVSMITCDCEERIDTKINSVKKFDELKEFFNHQVAMGIFVEIPVAEPNYIGHDKNGKAIEWYADKWYRCNSCGTLWEFEYPDFPAVGFVRKLNKIEISQAQEGDLSL